MAFNQDDGTLTIYTAVDTTGLSAGIKGITKSLKKLASSMKFMLGFSGFLILGKQAIQAASDLNEYRNVANNTFKEQISKLDELNKTVIETFGMSELTSTKAASSYMAMGRSIGIADDAASTMAINLTKLTGDFASFYNLSHERARTALSAVYTGETETLKQYGIILTQVNLQQYENTYGLGRSVQEMDSASKTLLRYNYIMQATADAQGDFTRTQAQWANQVRVLKERFTELLIVLGRGFISILSPVVSVLNKIISALTKAINFIGQAVAKLLHLKWQDLSASTTDASSSLDGLGDSAGDASDSENDLADSTKKASKAAKNALANFDDLNVLVQDTADSASGASGGLSGLGDVSADYGDTAGGAIGGGFSDPISDVTSWYDLGKRIADALLDMLKNIDWQKIYDGARDFGKNLADFLNGLINPELFYEVGKSIANSLNTVVYSALAFVEEFDWANFGFSLAAGLNGFIENIDLNSQAVLLGELFNGMLVTAWLVATQTNWTLLAHKIAGAINTFFNTFNFALLATAINAWALDLLQFMIDTLSQIDWSNIGTKIGTFLAKIDYVGVAKKVAELLWLAIDSAIKLYGAMFDAAPIQTIILTAIGLLTFTGIGSMLTKGFITGLGESPFTTFGTFVGSSLKTALSTGISNAFSFITTDLPIYLAVFADDLKAGFATTIQNLNLGDSLNIAMTGGFGTAITTILGLVALVGGAILSVVNFINQWKNGFDAVSAILTVVGATLVGVGLVVLGIASWPAIVVAAIIGAVAEIVIVIHDNWDSIVTWFQTTIATIQEKFTTFFQPLIDAIQPVIDAVQSFLQPIFDSFKSSFDTMITTVSGFVDSIVTGVTDLKDKIMTHVEDIKQLVSDKVSVLVETVAPIVDSIKEKIGPTLNNIKLLVTTIIQNISDKVSALADFLAPIIAFIVTVVIAQVTLVATQIMNFITLVVTGLQNIWELWLQPFLSFLVDIFFLAVQNVIAMIMDVLTPVIAFIGTVIDTVITLFNDLITFLIDVFSGNWKKAWTDIKKWFGDLWEGMKNIVKAAINIIIGFINGMIKAIENAINFIVDAVNSLSFNVPDWVPEIGGSKFGFDLPHASLGRIPMLAQGAVIPPNKQFLAMLGDQKSGTNVEAPLSTIEQAVTNAMSRFGGNTSSNDTKMVMDGETFARLEVPYIINELSRQGYNVSVLEE